MVVKIIILVTALLITAYLSFKVYQNMKDRYNQVLGSESNDEEQKLTERVMINYLAWYLS